MANESGVSQLVVVGASAGGIEALSTLVSTLPANFPAPLVIAQHLAPERPSYLAEILTRRSTLPVRIVSEQAPLTNGTVYVVPSNNHVEVTDHAISLHTADGGRSKPSIDLLLSTAARVFGESLIAVILTGTGTDGAAGARAVKEAGGMVVIQNPHTAQFSGMPSAIAPPLVDVVADLDSIGPLLHDLLTDAYTPSRPAENRTLRALLEQLHDASGIDFSHYKMPTIQRRVQRRMAATGMQRLADYVSYVETHPEEYERLVGTFLIKVTEYFRDPDLFSYLRDQVLPEIVAGARKRENEIRLWSAGCATGEEAYSLAILLSEVLGAELERFTVRIFATDLDATAVAYARRGIYPAAALSALPPEMIERYFTTISGGYEVSKRVRGLVVFGQHDLGQRPPFPHIDLCLCRNVLIYFTAELQQRALQLFAFALRDGGYLVLGKAETPSPLNEFFAPAHQQLKIYRRQGDRMLIPAARIRDTTPLRLAHGLAGSRPHVQVEQPPREPRAPPQRPRTSAESEAVLLRSLPIGVIMVDRHYDIRSLNAAARRLLGIHGTALGEDLVHLTERLPVPSLRAAIDGAFRDGAERTVIATIETAQGEQRYLRITCHTPLGVGEVVEPESSAMDDTIVVLVADITETERARRDAEEAGASEIARMREEQARLHEHAARLEARALRVSESNRELESANEQLSAVNVELRSANEEFLVGNEEMQAAMEEVETLNEELQATNEELETLNEELQATVEELNTTNDDLEARNLEARELAAEREEQRRISEAERARLAAVLLSMGDAVMVVDPSGAVVLTNAAVERLFGSVGVEMAPEDEVGRPLPSEAMPQARAARGESFIMTFTLRGADGAQRWFEATGEPIDSEEVGRGGVVVIRDITDRSLRRMQEEFLALASHELRTPLTPIRGYIQMLGPLLRREGGDQRAQRYIAQVDEQLRRLQRLVDDLLDVGRLQEGKLTLHLEPLDLATLVSELVEALRATDGNANLELEIEGQPLPVRGDSTRLEQILLNLVGNAVKYAPDSQRINVRLRREDSQIVLEVQDYGPGIAADRLPRIFDRFYQIEQPEMQSGLGVGLFVTRELVRAHGGEIEARSVEGDGSTFIVRLPLLDADALTEADAADQDQSAR